ncbi:MAG TPA: inositol monophosphatase family protein [Propionibacteriaceae bacterium]|nr:inositol monophosphatase family protein [Propionibacteriaceae bacterium]
MDDVSLAADLVREAGTLAGEMLGHGLETRYKTSISDVVSAADQLAEERITRRLAESRPGDGLVGEEGARKTGDGRTWYIDPVDGTYNFLSGIPYWCSAIGLVDGDGPLLGAVYYPAVDQLWVGGREFPTTLNGEQVPALVNQPLSEVSVATYLHPRHIGDRQRMAAWQSVIASAATARVLGSASVDMAEVASGRLGVFLQANLNPWDWYPGAALVIGAGGAADELVLSSNRWQIAGNAQAVEDVKSALQTPADG